MSPCAVKALIDGEISSVALKRTHKRMAFPNPPRCGHLSRRSMNPNAYKFLWITIALSLVLSPSAGEVKTETFCQKLAFNASSWEGNHTLPLFDPSQGNLIRIDLAAGFDVQQDFSFENQASSSREVAAESEVILSITTPNGSSISVNASNSAIEELAGFDGKMDFSGQSGRTVKALASSDALEGQYTEVSDFIASLPNETVSLPALLSVKSTASANVVLGLSTIAESEICVKYTFEQNQNLKNEKVSLNEID